MQQYADAKTEVVSAIMARALAAGPLGGSDGGPVGGPLGGSDGGPVGGPVGGSDDSVGRAGGIGRRSPR